MSLNAEGAKSPARSWISIGLTIIVLLVMLSFWLSAAPKDGARRIEYEGNSQSIPAGASVGSHKRTHTAITRRNKASQTVVSKQLNNGLTVSVTPKFPSDMDVLGDSNPPEFAHMESMLVQHLADWVRVAVLQEQGGIWMDASIMLTGSMDKILENQEKNQAEELVYLMPSYTTIQKSQQYGEVRYQRMVQNMKEAGYLKSLIASTKLLEIDQIPLPYYDLHEKLNWNVTALAEALLAPWPVNVPVPPMVKLRKYENIKARVGIWMMFVRGLGKLRLDIVGLQPLSAESSA
ncbi:hypothetical protein BC829DRAFT_401369 [Chytridium lagenaria]|nr:hypothetical protein BC829DRAFT_401369 [Chytridium lagenaria]